MHRILFSYARKLLETLFIGLVAGSLVSVAFLVNRLNSRPDLKVWHELDLDAEFATESPVPTFEEYLALEARLLAQLEKEVCDRIEPEDIRLVNRYHQGSLSDPGRWTPNWNRLL